MAKKNRPRDAYRESFTRNKSVKKHVTKTNLSTTLNTFLSILPYHFSVPLFSNQNLELSLQAVQRYAFQKIFYRVLRIVYFFWAYFLALITITDYLNS